MRVDHYYVIHTNTYTHTRVCVSIQIGGQGTVGVPHDAGRPLLRHGQLQLPLVLLSVLYVCLICVPYMCALYVCLMCVPYMCVRPLLRHGQLQLPLVLLSVWDVGFRM